ncbi:PRC-barrel domain-containing protein [Flavimaricola marinus]|uniref:PRC-barrel domain protein n=1 Tax=Flavimaricola marinus TaxID=1819565 RepID=A0A238LB84_9RHOB|nr:PRC-barrel domain-containing protein [Flavimaricola marinus]SMY06939.1 PRC-barrel domain protein [Flavimaricola marinus]
MTRFLTTAATALVLGTAAYADGHTSAFSDMTFDVETNLNASELIGMRVYASEADINNTIAADGETEWDDIGEINEIILTRSGEVQSVIVGVGGFLGIGEKDVSVNMSEIQFVNEEGDSDDFFLVINASTAGVEDAPAYERTALGAEMDDQMTDEEMAAELDTDMSEEMDTEMDQMEADARPMLTRPDIERDGFQTAVVEDLNTEDLTGARVYGVGDEDVGEISELLLTADGKLDRAVIDVGGFLGIGEHPVAVTLDELNIMRADGDGHFRVYIDASQEALEQQPAYEG